MYGGRAAIVATLMTLRFRASSTLLAVYLAGCTAPPPEPLENHWARADSPQAREARLRGWIPSWVPDGATELTEAHDPAAPESLLVFREPTVLIIPASCDVTDAAGVVRPTMTKPWWPSGEVLDGSRMMFYRCPPDDDNARMFIALASGEPWVYVWTTIDRRPR